MRTELNLCSSCGEIISKSDAICRLCESKIEKYKPVISGFTQVKDHGRKIKCCPKCKAWFSIQAIRYVFYRPLNRYPFAKWLTASCPFCHTHIKSKYKMKWPIVFILICQILIIERYSGIVWLATLLLVFVAGSYLEWKRFKDANEYVAR